jgi:putative hydroxymethylpyrimidine transport system substrate-binding protein
VIGGYRNIEALELKLQGKIRAGNNVEDYGVPAYDELALSPIVMKPTRR